MDSAIDVVSGYSIELCATLPDIEAKVQILVKIITKLTILVRPPFSQDSFLQKV